MKSGVVMSAIASHSPRTGIEASAPDFLRGVIAGSYALGRAIQALEPDVIVLQSAGPLETVPRRITIRRADQEKAYAEYCRWFAKARRKVEKSG